jgi:hypothetical protein
MRKSIYQVTAILSILFLFTLPVSAAQVAYWNFNGSDGIENDAAIDNAGDNDGVIYGAVAAAGKIGQALKFDGINDYINCASHESFDITDAITIELWAKEVGRIASGKYLARRVGVAFYQIGSYNGEINFSIGNGTGYNIVKQVATLDLNTWYHIVAVYDVNAGANKQGRLYINGVLDKEDAMNYNIGDLSGMPLTIGRYSTDYFNGFIDEVRLYDEALSPAQILINYQKGRNVLMNPNFAGKIKMTPSSAGKLKMGEE